jgi:hypothetical protein
MKTEKYFHLLQKAFGKISTAKFIRKLISDFKDDPRGYTEEKDLSRSDRGHYLRRGLARCCCDDGGCAVTVKIDPLPLNDRLPLPSDALACAVPHLAAVLALSAQLFAFQLSELPI